MGEMWYDILYETISAEREVLMDWTVLGIEPTKDKKAITAAYRGKLKVTNPEEKPEEFKILRAAYEAALEYAAKTEEAPAADNSPVGLWMARVRQIYDSFPLRCDADAWAELLLDEAVLAMDTRPKAEEALLKFFMEDYFIPRAVWQLLDSHFHWVERAEELYETFPRDFIDYAVLNGVRLEPNLPYELFSPGLNGKDCDAYRRLYHEANQCSPLALPEYLEKMSALSESHPYGDLLYCRMDFLVDDTRSLAMDKARDIAGAYPDNVYLQQEWAGMCAVMGEWDTVEALMLRLLDAHPDLFVAKRLLADSLAARGRYDEAKEHIYDMMRSVGGDQMQTYHLGQTLRRWNEELITRKEAALEAEPENTKNAIELGWCYLQNDRFEDALRMAKLASPDYEDQYDYYNFLSKVHYAREEYEPALENFYELERVMRSLDPTADEKTAKRKSRLPEVVQLQGSCLMALERKEEGKQRYLKALEMDPENAEILTYTARMFVGLKDYEAAVPILDRVIALMPDSYHGYYLMGQVLFELSRDREALDTADRALNYEGGDLGVYVLKMRIFLRNGVWEAVHDILDFLELHKVGDDASVLWCKAQLLEFEEGKRAEALAMYKVIDEKLEAGAYMDWAAKVYHRMAALSMDVLDMDEPEDRAQLRVIVDKGLQYDPEDPNCLEYKGWLLRREDKIDEALDIYHQLETYAHHPMAVEYNLAELYYKNLKKNAPKALEYYQKIIEQEENADLHFYAGTANRYLRNFKEAEAHFLREQVLAPEDVDGYNGLAYVYEAMGRLEDALQQVECAIAISKRQNGKHLFLYTHRVQILRRLGHPREAADGVYAAMAYAPDYNGYGQLFEIYTQFGLWDGAAKALAEQEKAHGRTGEWAVNRVRLLCMKEQPIKANLEYVRLSRYMDEEDKRDCGIVLAELAGKQEKVVQIWEARMDGKDKTHVLLNLAMAEFFAGRKAEAGLHGEQAAKRLEELLEQHLTDEALYRTRYAMALALLGREAEARRELERSRQLPLCAGCDYCACKDADIFEATIEEVLGNRDRAQELYDHYARKWPDELDFIIGKNRRKK